MELIKLKHRKDFGHEWYAQFLNIRGKSLLQLSVSWDEYPSWPYIQMISGQGKLFSFLISVHKFGFDFNLLGHTWNWDYFEHIDWNDDDLSTTP